MTVNMAARDFDRAVKMALLGMKGTAEIEVLRTMRVVANGALEVTATDLDKWVTGRVPYTGDHGVFLLPAPDRVARAVKLAGSDTIALTETDRPEIEIRSGALGMTVKSGAVVDDFPVSPAFAPRASATVGSSFMTALARMAGSMSQEETRYYLNGVFVHHVEGATHAMVTTDGHRLQRVYFELPDASAHFADMIIPKGAVRALLSLPMGTGAVRMTQGSAIAENTPRDLAPEQEKKLLSVSRVSFDHDDWSLITKTIDGTFPDYKRVFPPENAVSIRFDTAPLLAAVRAMAINKKTTALKLSFVPGAIDIAAIVPEFGHASVRVEAEHPFAGSAVGFNGRYLVEMLTSAKSAQVLCRFGDDGQFSNCPVTITSPEDPYWTGLIMPMRV